MQYSCRTYILPALHRSSVAATHVPNLGEPPEIYLYQTARQREMEKAQYNWDGDAICHPVCGWGWKQSEGKNGVPTLSPKQRVGKVLKHRLLASSGPALSRLLSRATSLTGACPNKTPESRSLSPKSLCNLTALHLFGLTCVISHVHGKHLERGGPLKTTF